ncbi:MAG: hypothetical protein IJE05_01425 [Clostridia bacterium]|nr:hypothetical protein [Clostridia bacterium]
MKRKRLFILICAMLICLASVGCQNISETKTKSETEVSTAETETESESEIQEMKETVIETSIAVQYSDREFSVYSDTSCFFTIDVDILDIDCLSTCNYGPFEISAGEKMNFTIDELSPDFFSDKAKIQNLSSPSTFVYGDSPLEQSNYKAIDAGIQFKCYADKIILRSNKDCFVCLTLQTKDEDFESGNAYLEMLKINANETFTFTLDDLAPGFYSDKAEITSYSPLAIQTYTKKQ